MFRALCPCVCCWFYIAIPPSNIPTNDRFLFILIVRQRADVTWMQIECWSSRSQFPFHLQLLLTFEDLKWYKESLVPLVGHVESKQRCRLKLELQRGEGESNWRTHLNPFWHCLLAIGANDLIPCNSCLNDCRSQSKAYPGNLDLYCNLQICFCFRPPRGVGAASIVFSCSSSFRPTYLPHSLTDCLEFRAFQPYIPNQNLAKPYLTYPTYLTYLLDLPSWPTTSPFH